MGYSGLLYSSTLIQGVDRSITDLFDAETRQRYDTYVYEEATEEAIAMNMPIKRHRTWSRLAVLHWQKTRQALKPSLFVQVRRDGITKEHIDEWALSCAIRYHKSRLRWAEIPDTFVPDTVVI